MTPIPQWLQEIKPYLRDINPQPDQYVALDSPEDEMPSLTESVVDMSDEELSYNYQLIGKWQAFKEFSSGVYAGFELASKKELEQVERHIYIDLKPQQPGKKFTNTKEADIIVKNDPRYLKAEDKYTAMKQAHEHEKSVANSYGRLALIYAGERKDRREREAKRLEHEQRERWSNH